MEQNTVTGTGRHGRPSRAHASGRLTAVPKRSQRKMTSHGEGTSASGSRRRPSREEPRSDDEGSEEHNDNVNMAAEDEDVDAEGGGYPGGPIDSSLLTLYHEHRAIKIWSADERDEIINKAQVLRTHGRKLISLEQPRRVPDYAWFWDVVDNSGLEPLLHTNYNVVNHGVMTAFAERWYPETATFHLPVGEMGITLDDIQCLLHIPITGRLLDHRAMSRVEGTELCMQLLGLEFDEVDNWFVITRGQHLPIETVKYIYIENWMQADIAERNGYDLDVIQPLRERCIRAFLLYILGCSIFTNKSDNCLDIVYLQYFADLNAIGSWNWGVAALTWTMKELDYSCKIKSKGIAGYLSMLEGWIISHFPNMTTWSFENNYEEDQPRCAMYYVGQGHTDVHNYRTYLDNLQMTNVIFNPYDSHRNVRPIIPECWFSGWIRCGHHKAKHLPERVMRQLGHVQRIPRHPSESAPPLLSYHDIDVRFEEDLAFWIIHEEERGAEVTAHWDMEPGYMIWYSNVSHLKMRPVVAPEEPPVPPNLEALTQELGEEDITEHLRLLRMVKVDLDESFTTGEIEPGSAAYDRHLRILGYVNPAVERRVRRRRRGEQRD